MCDRVCGNVLRVMLVFVCACVRVCVCVCVSMCGFEHGIMQSQAQGDSWCKKDQENHTTLALLISLLGVCMNVCECVRVFLCVFKRKGSASGVDWTKSQENPLQSQAHSQLSHFSFIKLLINITWFVLLQQVQCACVWVCVRACVSVKIYNFYYQFIKAEI